MKRYCSDKHCSLSEKKCIFNYTIVPTMSLCKYDSVSFILGIHESDTDANHHDV